jgi:protein-disulfide isomerase
MEPPRDAPLIPDLRRDRRRQLVIVGIVAVIVLALALNRSHTAPTALTPGQPVTGAIRAQALFRGIPQQGESLGRATAPLTLNEYGDLQCPVCASFADSGLLTLLGRVRAGQMRIVFHPLGFLGGDSQKGAAMALAVGRQNRLWQFVTLFYAHQGSENSGYVTNAFLRALATALPGVNVNAALAARRSQPVVAQYGRDATTQARLGIDAVPTFYAQRGGGPAVRLKLDSFSGGALSAALKQVPGA